MSTINFIVPDSERDLMLAAGALPSGEQLEHCVLNEGDFIIFPAAPIVNWRVTQRVLIFQAPPNPPKWWVKLERAEDPLSQASVLRP